MGALNRETIGLASDSGVGHYAAQLSRMFAPILPQVAVAVEVPTCWLHLVDEDSEDLVLIGSCGARPKSLLEGNEARAYAAIAREAAANGRLIVIEEPAATHGDHLRRSLRQAGYRSLIIIPLQSGETTIGFLGAASSATKLTPQPAALLEILIQLKLVLTPRRARLLVPGH